MQENKNFKLALDVMGTDNGPTAIIAGGVEAAREFGQDIGIVLVGREDAIKKELAKHDNVPTNIEIHHAPEEVKMSDSPGDVVRRTETSIGQAFQLHRRGEVRAVVSPGNTGAVMGTAMLRLGRLREVKRPAIASFFPTVSADTAILLDVGANAQCKPFHLYQFAIMGSIVSNYLFGHESPRVGLLTIGEERTKGNDLIVETHQQLEKNPALNFVGNVEGRDILSGRADVIVTDGFVGNVVLKFAESIEGFLTTSIRRQVSSNIFSRFGAVLMYPFLRRLRNTFDYAEYGGAPLLGVNGTVIICHGGSNSKAIRRGLTVARRMVNARINSKIEEILVKGNLDNGAPVDFNINGVYDDSTTEKNKAGGN